MTKNTFRLFSFVAALATLSGLGGCNSLDVRHDAAQNLATTAQMQKRLINAPPFILTVYERVNHKGGVATVYIEGDGLAWLSRSSPSLNPTPTNPVALALARKDNASNVIYMARPCQYSGLSRAKPCPAKYWTSNRFAPEVVRSMSLALDEIKTRYELQHFNLVGFSGGGAIAALLTARRNDVISLRTVVGNLDHARLNRNHNVSQMTGSLNPVDIASTIAHIPQHHFIGATDKIVTPDIYNSFRGAAGSSKCMRSSIIKNTSHEKGWVAQWPTLLKSPLDCHAQTMAP